MMKQVLLLLMVFCVVNGWAQIITTFAGCDTCSSSDGRPATLTALNDPAGGVFDRYGNYYFVQALGKRVRKVNTIGIINTIAGTGTSGLLGDGGLATLAHLNIPSAVILDSIGNIYIADAGDNRIRKIDITTGIITTIAGNGTGGFSGDNGQATAAKIWDPQDICFDKFGNLYISEAFNYRIRKVDIHGIITTFAGTGGLGPLGDGGPATDAVFNLPAGITADDTGNIYIADNSANRVRKVNTSGIITTVAGNGTGYIYSGDGMPATDANLSPIRLAIDSMGNLVIADKINRRILKVDQVGIIHNIAGNGMTGYSGDLGMATAASIDYPGGLSFDPCGNLYIPEPNNRRIRKVTFNASCIIEPLDIKFKFNFTSLEILPNPVMNTLFIHCENELERISIENYLSQTIFTQTYTTTKAEIDMSGYPAGVYIVRVRDKDGGQIVRKVVKE